MQHDSNREIPVVQKVKEIDAIVSLFASLG